MFKRDLKTKRLLNVFMAFALALATGVMPGCSGDESNDVSKASGSSDFTEDSLCIKTKDNGYGNTWRFQLQGVDGTLEAGTNYLVEVYFMPEDMGDPTVPNDGKNNLHGWGCDVDFDMDLLSCLGVMYNDYMDPTNPFRQIWDGGIAPTGIDNEVGYIYDINGFEPGGVWDSFFPDEAEHHLATIYFEAKVSGTFENMMTWNDPDVDCLVFVDGVSYNYNDLYPPIIWKEGNIMNLSYQIAEYILHLGVDEYGVDSFPQEITGEPFYTGPAAAGQTLNWIYGDPYNLYSVDQASLYSTYHNGTAGQDMSAADMRTLLQSQKPTTTPVNAYNFTAYGDADEALAVKRIVHWTDFNVQTYYPSGTGINEPQVPALFATFNATYGSQWKTIRGLATDMDPCDESSVFIIPDMTVYGLWINDPAQGGLGYNVYLTGDEFQDMYEPIEGQFRSVCEPPNLSDDEMEQLETSLEGANVCFERGMSNKKLADKFREKVSMLSLNASSKFSEIMTRELIDESWEEIIPEQLLNAPDFNNIYTKCTLAQTIQVVDLDNGDDYILVTFSQSGNNSASIVLQIDVNSGRFRKATWTLEDMEYLPISKVEALQIATNALHKEMKISTDMITKKFNSLIRLVHNKECGESCFMPMYEVNIFNNIVYVMQDGSYSLE